MKADALLNRKHIWVGPRVEKTELARGLCETEA